MNTDSCGGAPGISDAFVSALWALDAAFQMARVGVDGVNIHTYPGAPYALFSFTQRDGSGTGSSPPSTTASRCSPRPRRRAPRLLKASGSLGNVEAWATRAPDGAVHVVLINEDTARAHTVAVRLPGVPGTATLERLEARGIAARTGVTLGGQTYGADTTTGTLSGPSTVASVAPTRRGYVVTLPRASAAMLTLAAPSPG